MQRNAFPAIIHTVLKATRISDLLIAGAAVILERLARGGGTVRWYYCPDLSHLERVEEQLSPGSVVSFYFDGRIRSGTYSEEIKSSLEKIIAEEGEAIIGCLNEDGLRIDIEIVAGLNDIADYVTTFGSVQRVFYGAFPARDNDGELAVTVVLPDRDGSVRDHPH